MSSEGRNENSNSGQPKYDLDLDALADEKKASTKPRSHTVELTVVKRTREQAEKQTKDIQQILNQRLANTGLFEAVGKMASMQTGFAKAIGTSIQAAQPAMHFAKQVAEMQKSITRSVEPVLETMRTLGKQIQEMMEAIRKSLPSYADIFKRIGTSITSRINPFIKLAVSKLSNFKPPPLAGFLKHCIEQVGKLARNVFSNFNFAEIFKPIADFFRLLTKSNFYLVVRSSEGDTLAAKTLAKIWWRLAREYYKLERRQGHEPTEAEFQLLIQETCLKVLKENEHREMSWGLRAAQTVFYTLVHHLAAQYIYINDSKVASEWVEFNVYIDEQTNNEYVFLRTLAQQVGISEQTLRNWVNEGRLEAVKTSFYSKLRNSKAVTFLVPYQEGIVTELRKIKAEKQMSQRHQKNDIYTVSQVANAIGISTKTLRRWDEKGILVPQRIKSIRYYSLEQIKTIPHILEQNGSPRTMALRQRFA